LLQIAFSAVLGLALGASTVWAHTTVEVGEYEIEVGWANEPPVVGQANQIVIDIQPKPGSDAPQADLGTLSFTVSQGDFNEVLAVVSAGEAPGEYEAAFTPGRAGQYTLTVQGTLNGQAIDVAIDPEPVEPGAVTIPSVQLGEEASVGPFPLIAVGAVVVAVVLGLAALLMGRKSS
jgi:hypothetical protein